MNDTRTKFEQDLEAFFPEIYKLYVYGKLDESLIDLMRTIYVIVETRGYSKIVISFQDGKINHATEEKSVVHKKGGK